MNRDELLRVLRAFEVTGLEYVLIGATAMGFHGLLRATEDVDLFVRATADNIERLRRAFRATYEDPSIDEIQDGDLLGEYPFVRYYPPTGDLFFDVMTRLGEAASFDTIESQDIEIEGIRVRVATPAALYRLKKDTPRPLDRRDAGARERTIQAEGRRLMAVQKFRSGEEMNAAPVRVLGRLVRPVHPSLRPLSDDLPPSLPSRSIEVFRFRSIEEAQLARERAANEGLSDRG